MTPLVLPDGYSLYSLPFVCMSVRVDNLGRYENCGLSHARQRVAWLMRNLETVGDRAFGMWVAQFLFMFQFCR